MKNPTLGHTLHRVDCICVRCENIRKAAMQDACSIHLNDIRIKPVCTCVGCLDRRRAERSNLEAALETAVMGLHTAVDGFGKPVILHYGPMTTRGLARSLFRLVELRLPTSELPDVNQRVSTAAWARNCLLLAQAVDAAAALEAVIDSRLFERYVMSMERDGVLFGRAMMHD